jgi:hypothetical protein
VIEEEFWRTVSMYSPFAGFFDMLLHGKVGLRRGGSRCRLSF